MATLPSASVPEGLKIPGNLDLNNRPVVHNSEGSVSTELSFSKGTDKGEVLVPQVVNGKMLDQKDAWHHYLQTGEHLGIFDSPENANAYAEKVHQRSLPIANQSHPPLYVMPMNSSPAPQKKTVLINPLIDVLMHYGDPVNRDTFIRTAYAGKSPKLDPESEAELPQDDSRFMAFRPTTHEELKAEEDAKAAKAGDKPKPAPKKDNTPAKSDWLK